MIVIDVSDESVVKREAQVASDVPAGYFALADANVGNSISA
jgi:hypothetical protein